MKKILCFFGIHGWWISPAKIDNGETVIFNIKVKKCKHCGKTMKEKINTFPKGIKSKPIWIGLTLSERIV